MISDVLKDRTRQSHQSLEKTLVGLLKNIQTKDDYLYILRLFYSFIYPLEREINRFSIADAFPDYSERRKAGQLVTDMQSLGRNAKDEDLCKDLPPIHSVFEAAGTLYVLEGSTLGGQVISRMISDKLPSVTDNSLSFFNSYGGDTLPMWRKFQDRLNSLVTNEVQQAETVRAAESTFNYFKTWIDKKNEQKEL